MSGDSANAPAFAIRQQPGLLDFWQVYEREYDRIQQVAMALALAHPEFAPLIRGMPPERLADENRTSRELLRAAIVEGRWGPYEANTRLQGGVYAKLGVSFQGWYEIVRVFQQALVPSLVDAYAHEPARLVGAITAMMSFIDHAMTLIAEQYLRTKEEDRFRLLVDAIDDYAVFMLDPQGAVASWNAGARSITGYEEAEILGRHVSVFYPQEERGAGKAQEELSAAASTGRFEEEGWRLRKDGSRFWAHVTLTAVRSIRGEILGFAKVTRDLTEQRRVEEEREAHERELVVLVRRLEDANQELDGFTYSVSHDLRAPLRAIDGFVRVLVEDHAPRLDEEGKRVVGIISKNTQRMGQLIDDLLNFARLGRQEVHVSRVDMRALARAAAAEVFDPKRSIEWHMAELPQAPGDAALLRQVWLNLLGNAAKYTGPRSPAIIEVTGEEHDREIVYSVKDNGVGFDDKYRGKLFGVFSRLHTAAEFEGTGVGLALVQRIVRRHGGWVKAEGKVGEGATFTFALPKKDGPNGA